MYKMSQYKKEVNGLEFLVINESKLKIIMTPEDTAKYDFSSATADYDSPDTRRLFWRILDEAHDEVGFDPKGDKILIQFYPSRDGGCEIFVTKLGVLTASAARLVTKSENVTMLSRASTLYRFSSISELEKVSKIIAEKSYPRSDAYLADNGICFLNIEERGGSDPSEYPCICEFAAKCPPELLHYVKEHCECIAEDNAVLRLAKGAF